MGSCMTADLKPFSLQLSQLIPAQRLPALVPVPHVVRKSALPAQDFRTDKQCNWNIHAFTNGAKGQKIFTVSVIHSKNDGWPSDGVRTQHFNRFRKRNNLVVIPQKL